MVGEAMERRSFSMEFENWINERIRGRKARVSPNSISLLSGRRRQTTYQPLFFFFILYSKLKMRCLFKILWCHDDTWFHLDLTFLKPWDNQCIFLMEMFFLSYGNKLCIYLRLCLSSDLFHLRLRTDNVSTKQYVLLMEMFS